MDTHVIYVGNPSLSVRLILGKNEKFEQYIKMKTHKPIALRFWVGGSVNPLCGLDSYLIGVIYLLGDPPSKDSLVV